MHLICHITFINFVVQKPTKNNSKEKVCLPADPSSVNSEEDNDPSLAGSSDAGDIKSVASAASTRHSSRRKRYLQPEEPIKKAKTTLPDEADWSDTGGNEYVASSDSTTRFFSL